MHSEALKEEIAGSELEGRPMCWMAQDETREQRRGRVPEGPCETLSPPHSVGRPLENFKQDSELIRSALKTSFWMESVKWIGQKCTGHF